MRSIYIVIVALGVCVSTKDYGFNQRDNPIRVVKTSIGRGGHERIAYLYADIHPYHKSAKGRISFPTSGKVKKYFQAIKADGDVRGHLLAPRFSGPPKWYNLSPQNAQVNRNARYQSITREWYATECEVANFLSQGGNQHVSWTVNMTFTDDSNRPDEYHLQIGFLEENIPRYSINIYILNPLKSPNSSLWICRRCHLNGTPACLLDDS